MFLANATNYAKINFVSGRCQWECRLILYAWFKLPFSETLAVDIINICHSGYIRSRNTDKMMVRLSSFIVLYVIFTLLRDCNQYMVDSVIAFGCFCSKKEAMLSYHSTVSIVM